MNVLLKKVLFLEVIFPFHTKVVASKIMKKENFFGSYFYFQTIAFSNFVYHLSKNEGMKMSLLNVYFVRNENFE